LKSESGISMRLSTPWKRHNHINFRFFQFAHTHLTYPTFVCSMGIGVYYKG
jgi:hypothetical protein